MIKEKLTCAPVLILPNFSYPFELTCDALKVGTGAILSQNGRPIAFVGEKLIGPRSCYSTYDVKFYVVVCTVHYWRHYLYQQEFLLYTDHDALKHLNSQDTMSSRRAFWVAYLLQFTFILKHKSGASNQVADALSRRHLVLTNMHTTVLGFELLPDSYASNPFLTTVLFGLGDSTDSSYRLVASYLFRGVQLVHSSVES